MPVNRRKTDRRMSPVPLYEDRERRSFFNSLFMLMGHVVGGALLFIGIAAISWGLGFAVATLHAIHPFSPAVLDLLNGVEEGLLYLDMGLSGIVLLVGAFRFLKEIVGARP